MKKLLCMLMALVLSVSLAVPAFAANEFVPSITYKDGPEVDAGTMNGEQVTVCLVVTSITEAKEKTTDITQEERDQLLELYDKLDSGEMKLPLANDEYVIRELVDVSYAYIGCTQDHDHEEWLKQEGNTVTARFDLGVPAGAEVAVMVYNGAEWVAAEKVVNCGNGIVEVVFEDLGPVAFCVKSESQSAAPTPNAPQTTAAPDGTVDTGDTGGQQILLWGAISAGSVAALLILFVLLKRSKKEEDENKDKK